MRVFKQETWKATSGVEINHIYPFDCCRDACIIEMEKKKIKLFSCGVPGWKEFHGAFATALKAPAAQSRETVRGPNASELICKKESMWRCVRHQEKKVQKEEKTWGLRGWVVVVVVVGHREGIMRDQGFVLSSNITRILPCPIKRRSPWGIRKKPQWPRS